MKSKFKKSFSFFAGVMALIGGESFAIDRVDFTQAVPIEATQEVYSSLNSEELKSARSNRFNNKFIYLTPSSFLPDTDRQ